MSVLPMLGQLEKRSGDFQFFGGRPADPGGLAIFKKCQHGFSQRLFGTDNMASLSLIISVFVGARQGHLQPQHRAPLRRESGQCSSGSGSAERRVVGALWQHGP